jgi:hypothetical protein
VSAIQEAIIRQMVSDGEYQALMTGERTPGVVEAEWIASHTCGCHRWYPDWRCHVVQAERAAR